MRWSQGCDLDERREVAVEDAPCVARKAAIARRATRSSREHVGRVFLSIGGA
jgi:hypothetical protein